MTILNKNIINNVLKNIPDPAFIIDINNNIIFWNNALSHLTNIDSDKVLNTTDYTKYFGHNRPGLVWYIINDKLEDVVQYNFYENLKCDIENNQYSAEVSTLINNKQKNLWLSCSIIYDDENNIIGGIEFIRDITKYNVVKKQMKAYSDRFKGIINALPDLFFRINKDNEYVEFHGDETKLHRSVNDIIGKTPMDIFNYEFGTNTIKLLEETRKTKTIQIDNYEILDTLGSSRHFLRRLVPLENNEVLSIIQDITELKKKDLQLLHINKQLSRKIGELSILTDQIVLSLSSSIQYSDPYTYKHHLNVANICKEVCRYLNFPPNMIKNISIAGQLHDIGKLAIPAQILVKPSQLSSIEFELVKEHTTVGYEILKNIPFECDIATMILQHHERLDGSGYPYGLVDEDICIGAKIIAVADAYDAMITHRPYRAALNPVSVRNILNHDVKLKKIDGEIVDALLHLVDMSVITIIE